MTVFLVIVCRLSPFTVEIIDLKTITSGCRLDGRGCRKSPLTNFILSSFIPRDVNVSPTVSITCGNSSKVLVIVEKHSSSSNNSLLAGSSVGLKSRFVLEILLARKN